MDVVVTIYMGQSFFCPSCGEESHYHPPAAGFYSISCGKCKIDFDVRVIIPRIAG